jgi:tetratricopeptide (TPR) repeat protein
LAALLLPVALVGILEIALRLGGYGYDPDFFKPIKIGAEECLVQNDDFSLTFFPPETVRSPGPIRMPARKAPGTFRIFIFGESAAMGDPEPAYGPGRYLEMLLRERFPGTKFEVINVAFTAINSHVIVPIARECARHEGDLWIIYMGNNEMVGPFGAATVFGVRAPPLAYVRISAAVQRTRTGQLLASLARRWGGHAARSASWAGMGMFLQNQVAPDSPLRETVYRSFQRNLDDIVRAGLHSGAKVLLNTVAVNLKDCPPFASVENSYLPPTGHARFVEGFAEARHEQTQSNFAAAARLYAEAAKLDGASADLQYRWGECQLAQTNYAAAREHFQAACDDDALPFRADSKINGVISEEGKRFAGTNLILLDAPVELAATGASGLCGDEVFYEHAHFDFDGSYRLGLAWAKRVEPLLPASITRNAGAKGWSSRDLCEVRLGLSDWNRALVIEHMAGRMQGPPFSNQPNNGRRMERLRERAAQLRTRMSQDAAVRAREQFLNELERAPEDFMLRENFALFLQSIGDLPRALAEWRRIRDLIPQDYLPCFQIGRLLGAQQQWSEAETLLRKAVELRPGLTEGWMELGDALARQGKFEEALAGFSRARRQRPQDPQTAFRAGKVLARLGRHAEAVQAYRDAIALDPANWESHFELGAELDAASQLDAAGDEFAGAARLNPGYSRTHFNYGVVLAKQGRLPEAQREFAEALRLDPGYKNAQDALEKARILLQRSSNK